MVAMSRHVKTLYSFLREQGWSSDGNMYFSPLGAKVQYVTVVAEHYAKNVRLNRISVGV